MAHRPLDSDPRTPTAPPDMKTDFKLLFLAGALLLPAAAGAQQYSNTWYKVSGGGGTSTNGQYSISGTIGQQDAGGPMTGGGFSVSGGFWAIYALQSPGLPTLRIRFVAPDSVVVFWPNTGSYSLRTNGFVNSSNWIDFGGPVTTANGTNSVTFTPPRGNLFFRLSQP